MKESKELPNGKSIDKDIWADPDLAELLFASEVNRENEVISPKYGQEDEEEPIEAPDTQDPPEAWDLYHGTIQPLLKKHLSGATKTAKKLVREQVNLLLKDGKKKHRDGKQAYLYRMREAIAIIRRWEVLCAANEIPPSETRMFRLFVMFKDAVDSIVQQNNGQTEQ